MIKKILIGLLILIVVAILTFMLGPKPEFEAIDFDRFDTKLSIDKIESYVAQQESKITDLKPGNAAKVVWADSSFVKTPYVLLYLHGFSSSHEEGNPVHHGFAKHFGMNLYLSRLADHGRATEDTFKDWTASDYYESAEEALEIAKTLGDSVVIMSCSTGGTLSALLATEHPEIQSHIMFSPNIDIADPASNLTVGPWGKQLLRTVMGGDHTQLDYGPEQEQYWNERYHINGIITLKHLLKDYMTAENFATITQPVFMGYYYKNEEEQDQVVSVARMQDFFGQISTPSHLKQQKAYPDARGHVFTAQIFDAKTEVPLRDAITWWSSIASQVK